MTWRRLEQKGWCVMKAAVFKNLGQPLQIETVPDPAPEATELVVKVAYCGICGTDLH